VLKNISSSALLCPSTLSPLSLDLGVFNTRILVDWSNSRLRSRPSRGLGEGEGGGEGEEGGEGKGGGEEAAAHAFAFLWQLVVDFGGPEEPKGERQGGLVRGNQAGGYGGAFPGLVA
jgi:hypothetical protein